LADLSPLNPIPEDHLLVVLKSYFDGGNQVDPQYDRVTLAVVCGTSNQWKRFNIDWKKTLYQHQSPPLHTTDAVSLQNEFCVERGWDNQRVDTLIDSCIDVIERHIALPRGMPKRRPRTGLMPVTLTIKFEEWLRARKSNPSIADTIEETCASQAMSLAFKWGTHIGARYYELYFDRGEKFYGHIANRYNNPKARKDITPMEQVIHLGESDMHMLPALQMADLFAWCINRANQERRDWHKRLHSMDWHSLTLGYEELINPRPKALGMVARWNLPKRRSSERVLAGE
jgi:hypothetical protein